MKIFLLGFAAFPLLGTDLAPYLSDERLNKIKSLLVEQNESQYQALVQKQTLADLLQLYDPKNKANVQTTYASFTAEQEAEKSNDLGLGLHVVKRLKLTLPNGKTKVVDVNEQWGHNVRNDGLFLPDEIRIKTLIFEGERHIPGSHKLYLFDQIRIAWGPEGQAAILRQEGSNTKQMRVPVTAPYSCMMCHDSTSGGFREDFLQKNEKENFEAIVQDSHFKLPVSEMKGYREYMDYLQKKSKPEDFISKIREGLSHPDKTFEVPGLVEALNTSLKNNSIQWLPEDTLIASNDYYAFANRQGVYSDNKGNMFIEALEDVFEGKYRWWDPLTVLP